MSNRKTTNALMNGLRRPKKSRRISKISYKGENRPFILAVVKKVYTITPKKPNSAIRKVAKVTTSDKRTIIAYIPGIGHEIKEHFKVLVRAGRRKDLIGIRAIIVRGPHGTAVKDRKTARSKYGVAREA
jgi:small subunit ribosomal protein S12